MRIDPIDTVLCEVIAVIRETLGFADGEITETTNLTEDLGLDSLDLLQAVIDLEECFGRELPDDAVTRFRTITSLAAYLGDYGADANRAVSGAKQVLTRPGASTSVPFAA